MKARSKEIVPLPFAWYFIPTVVIGIFGLSNAVYLAVSHYRVYTDMAYKSFCAVSRAINCDTVSQSPFSIFLDVPVPVWGVAGYTLFLALLFINRKPLSNECRVWPTLFLVSFCFSIYSVVLALISTFYIHSYCIMCVASYGVNFALLYLTWLTHSRYGRMSMIAGLKHDFRYFIERRKKSVAVLSAVAALLAALILLFPAYWKIVSVHLDQTLTVGVTADGHPWIGAENPELIITEFTDYQCFQCKKMHFYLRELVSSYPNKIRLVHRNFPMDHTYHPLVKEPFHVGSATMALLSFYAVKKGKFWEANDLLFNIDNRKGYINIREIAEVIGFEAEDFARAVQDGELQYKLLVDIREGMKLGVLGTPAYLINGDVYLGYVPPEIIQAVLE